MRLFAWCGALSAVCVAVAGCGHPASVEECELIVERMARLELQEQNPEMNAEQLQREIQSTKQELRDATMEECVGKRITEDALQCVQTAESPTRVKECFD